MSSSFEVRPVGVVRSTLSERDGAPRQPDEGAPDAMLVFDDEFRSALDGIGAGAVIELLTWLHEADRSTLQTRPRSDPSRPMAGVFATRSPDRPNPIGLHTVRVVDVGPGWLRVDALEAIDETPVLDVKISLRTADKR